MDEKEYELIAEKKRTILLPFNVEEEGEKVYALRQKNTDKGRENFYANKHEGNQSTKTVDYRYFTIEEGQQEGRILAVISARGNEKLYLRLLLKGKKKGEAALLWLPRKKRQIPSKISFLEKQVIITYRWGKFFILFKRERGRGKSSASCGIAGGKERLSKGYMLKEDSRLVSIDEEKGIKSTAV